MDLYPWRFDSIYSHCHDDVKFSISILNISIESWYIAHLRGAFKKSHNQREPAEPAVIGQRQIDDNDFISNCENPLILKR
jgi:hypothetical protein